MVQQQGKNLRGTGGLHLCAQTVHLNACESGLLDSCHPADASAKPLAERLALGLQVSL